MGICQSLINSATPLLTGQLSATLLLGSGNTPKHTGFTPPDLSTVCNLICVLHFTCIAFFDWTLLSDAFCSYHYRCSFAKEPNLLKEDIDVAKKCFKKYEAGFDECDLPPPLLSDTLAN